MPFSTCTCTSLGLTTAVAAPCSNSGLSHLSTLASISPCGASTIDAPLRMVGVPEIELRAMRSLSVVMDCSMMPSRRGTDRTLVVMLSAKMLA